MAEMVTLTIDGRKITAPAGTTILEAAQDANIDIPHLCYNEDVAPYGACRLCMVEINDGKRTRLVASCNFEVKAGLEVKTDTERVLNVRRLVIELLMARSPEHHVLRKIATDLGVKETRFVNENKNCILCGLCIRACKEVVGVSAIGFEGRGQARKVAAPFRDFPPDCIACGSCVYICPTQFIPMKEKDGVRTIIRFDFPMQQCKKCGRFFMPKRQIEHYRKIAQVSEADFETCVDCR